MTGRTTFATTLDPDEDYRATALGRAHRLLDEERRRGKALADAVRAYMDGSTAAAEGWQMRDLRAALAAWGGR